MNYSVTRSYHTFVAHCGAVKVYEFQTKSASDSS